MKEITNLGLISGFVTVSMFKPFVVEDMIWAILLLASRETLDLAIIIYAASTMILDPNPYFINYKLLNRFSRFVQDVCATISMISGT